MKAIYLRCRDAIDESFALRLTLFILLVRPPGHDVIRGAIWLVGGAALLMSPLIRSARVWLLLTFLMAWRLVDEWPLADNHLYLLTYWCLAIALALATPAPSATLARSARWLMGCTFLCAVLWKALLAPDFLDARFFRVTLLTDDRFAGLTRAVGGLTEQALSTNRAALTPIPAGLEILDGPVLVEPPTLRALGLALTWGGVTLEALLAAAFLAAWPRWLVAARHPLLVIFCLVTYVVAPVAGFGWLLAAMGLAQVDVTRGRWRVAYAGAAALVLVYAETPLIAWIIQRVST